MTSRQQSWPVFVCVSVCVCVNVKGLSVFILFLFLFFYFWALIQFECIVGFVKSGKQHRKQHSAQTECNWRVKKKRQGRVCGYRRNSVKMCHPQIYQTSLIKGTYTCNYLPSHEKWNTDSSLVTDKPHSVLNWNASLIVNLWWNQLW